MVHVAMPEVDASYVLLQTGNVKKSLWQQFRSNCFQMKMLIWWTLLGVSFGLIGGLSMYQSHLSPLAIELIGYPGELLIRALQELVLPLMVFALMSGVFNLRHSSSGAGRIIRWSLLYYLMSMLLAVTLGITLVYIIQPGRSSPFTNSAKVGNCGEHANITASLGLLHAEKSAISSLLNIGRDLVPTNIIAAAALPNYMGVITFAIVFACALNSYGERAEQLIRTFELLNEIFLKLIYMVIAVTPLGVASLLASTILKSCSLVELIKALALYVGTVIVIIIIIIVCKCGRKFTPALLLGFGTSSSAASMPVAMKCAEEYGCANSIVRFIIPMGTNINRDGAALYEAVSVMFICQAHGLSLSIGSVVVVALTATLAAIGSASIPNSALVSMITILQALGLQEYIPDVAVLYSVDWLLGMVRTTVNVWGDSNACVVVDTWAKRYAKKQERLPITVNRSAKEEAVVGGSSRQ
nr:excitatory amino acid transporter 4-like isoform X2 [Physcomitrium patens]|eukprot:XP_024363269.1 excitatory amino acid transporter 4-like isoform X2 [Physcomitrella patens]